jgi:O-antigen ligase
MKALEKHPFWIANFAFAVLTIIFLQSRSALLVFLVSNALLLLLLKRKKLLIFFSGTLLAVSLLWLPETLIHGFTTGFDSGTADAVLTGRVDRLWIPLVTEWLENPRKLFFGAGRYGILTSPLWVQGFLIPTSHAHNAFLDFFLENGIILFGFLVFFIITFMTASWRVCKQIDTPLCWSLFVSLFAYLVATITDRQLFPNVENMLLFPSIALLINAIRLHLYGDCSHQDKSCMEIAR